MLEFILARYNYWIVICLMITGLYIVFSGGNLVKTLIGLNLFQTSVFIFYITVGKVIGGTAPILLEEKKDGHGDGHGDDHGWEPASASDAPVGFFPSGEASQVHIPPSHVESEPLHGIEAPVNDLSAAVSTEQGNSHGDSLHLQPPAVPANELLPNALDEAGHHSSETPFLAADHAEVLYSNPLPHVLILTAIVVGVATTAVGLALAVRIREAYGTVEEDQLEAMDNASDVAEASH